jgi:DNA helicase II / ATP-dependent DNA helicase PcrA
MVARSILNREQVKVISHREGPMLVIAGAGTGKTQVISLRIANLIKKKNQPESILAVTFTDKAALEMENRIIDAVGKFLPELRVKTFNSFGQEILERFGFEIGLGLPLKLLNSAQKIVFLRDHIDELQLDYYAPVTKPDKFIGELAKYFSQLKNEYIQPLNYIKYAKKLNTGASNNAEQMEARRHLELAKAYDVYIKLTRQNAVLDFDDQLFIAVELLKKRSNVLSRINNELKYILVDEFQDTNPVQNELINLISGERQNIMVVGDDDQSIYRFRGAAVENILEFKDRYKSAKQVTLIKNYRSSQEILDSAYKLIQHNNPNRLEAKYNINKRLTSEFTSKIPVVKGFLSIEEEAEWVAKSIKKRIISGQKLSSIAVLLRQNQQADLIATYLKNESINYRILGQSLELFAQPEVKLLLNLIRTVSDVNDSVSLYHILTSEIYKTSPVYLGNFISKSRRQNVSLEVVLRGVDGVFAKGDEEYVKINLALSQINDWRSKLNTLSAGKICYIFLQETRYLQDLLSKAKNDPDVDKKISNINKFFTLLLDFERVASDSSVFGFLDNLSVLSLADTVETHEDYNESHKLNVLTIHKAKGLEFDTVYVYDVVQNTLPSRRHAEMLEVPAELLSLNTANSFGNTDEERRLMYVALTRARKDLILTYSIDHGGKQLKKPSQFLLETFDSLPVLDLKSKKIAQTKQIELFGPRTETVSAKKLSRFMQGNRMVLTARQIEDYIMCPAEFMLRHILKPPSPTSFALEYGTLIHEAIQLYNRSKIEHTKLTTSYLRDYLRSNWPKEGFLGTKHNERGLKQAEATIQHFYKREELSKRYPKYVEYPFRLKISNKEVEIHGRFDAVYEENDYIEIRDYKTGASNITDQVKADTRTKSNLQLGIYALAWQQLKNRSVTFVSLDFVDSGYIGYATKTARQLKTVEIKINNAVDGIKRLDFTPGSSHIFCTHQEFGF